MRISTTLLLLAALLAGVSNATPITIGSLSYVDDGRNDVDGDGKTDVFTDSLNNREWLRWDVVPALDYAQTLNAIDSGGLLEGFSLATTTDADALTRAMFGGGNACDGYTGRSLTTCGAIDANDAAGLFGQNYISDFNGIAWVVSDNGVEEEAGYVRYIDSLFYTLDEWSTIEATDIYSSSGTLPNIPITWLLYREMQVQVPEPTTLVLLGLGLAGFTATRRRSAAPRQHSLETPPQSLGDSLRFIQG